MMITPQYEGFYGSIERVGKSSVQTLFYHFLGFPLFPQDTYWVSGSDAFSWSNLRVMEIKRSVPSIVVGYLRGWTTVGSLWLAAAGAFGLFVVDQPAFPGDPMPFGHTVLGPIALALGILGLAASVVLWLATRRAPTEDELARRAVFQSLLGTDCDPAMLKDPWSQRDNLKNGLAQIAEALGLGRSTDLFHRWRDVAIRPDAPLPPQALKLALTIARLERSAPAEGTDPASLPALEDALWQRLLAMDPSARAGRPT